MAGVPSSWQPSEELLDFLANGEDAPIYIGFGSMVGTDPEGTTRAILKAIGTLNIRAILTVGWGGIRRTEQTDNRILFVDDVPLEWLFPRVRLAAHHGGVGTVSAALRAGIPQVVMPFIEDQFFYARRLHDLGVAPDPLPQHALTPQKLAKVVREALEDNSIFMHAERLRRHVQAEEGADGAVRIIESIIN
ncbi:glycosyltransferase [Phytoactinopolyspora halotolerans]|uniref:glycosyltransferase n=1 Tax=Phytoactinopolyspora halotolerans TaxID=1981512 RepID=UPI0028A7394F|nr:glycosyltransferase [Phytoactinopolyspora halotolerans]